MTSSLSISPASIRSVEPAMEGHTAVPSSVFIISSDGRTVKLPIPSSSPRDPLNWSLLKRSSAFATLLFFTITSLCQTLGPGVIFPALIKEYENSDRGPFGVDILASGGSLFTGLGAFLWVPLSLAIGRRPVFLFCNIILIVGTVWATYCHDFWQHLIAICLQGFALAIMPTLIILIIIDLTFVHERATAISLFSTLCGVTSNSILTAVPILVDRFGWRSFYAAGIPPAIISFFLALFFFPETYFVRPPVAFDGRVIKQSSTEKVSIYDGWSELLHEKSLPDIPTTTCRLRVNELKFWGTTTGGGFQAMKYCYPQIFLSFFNPLVLWVTVLKALILGCFIAFGVTFPALLSAPPYNYGIGKISLIYLSAAAGAILSFGCSGPIMARISLNLASRNGGHHYPEHYLAGFILPILLGTGGQVLYGFAGEEHLQLWTIFLAYAMISLSFISLYTVTALWSTEVFPRWAAAGVVVVSGGAYILSFALSFSIIPWIREEGFLNANCELGGLFFVVGCLGIPIAIWGKKFRCYVEHRWGESEAGALRPH